MTHYKFNAISLKEKKATERFYSLDTARQLPQSLLMPLMSFPYSQLPIHAVVLGLSWPAVQPYVSVISATKAYITHQPGTI